MASTYTVNLGIEKPAPGEQAGTWGGTVNNDLDQLDQAISGYAEVTLTGTGTTDTPNEVKITNESNRSELSNGRNLVIKFVDGADLGGNVYVRFTPSTSKKVGYITNNLSGDRDLYLFQGTYNASRDLVISAGTTSVVRFDGGGDSSATVTKVNLSELQDVEGAGAIMDGDFASNGLMIRTDSGAYTSRTLSVGTKGGILVANGNGVASNPTVEADYTISTSAPSGTPAKGHVWYRY